MNGAAPGRRIARLFAALVVVPCACNSAADAPRSRRALAHDGAAPARVEPVPAPPPPVVPPAASAQPEQAPWPRARPPRVETDWCIDGVDALDEETCYALPDAPTRALLIYLHGIVPPGKESQQKTNFETVVARASRRAGVAALMPRGKVGLAPKGYASWWGWPTGGPAYAKHAAAFVATFAEKRRKLEEIAGAPFARVYVAGSSSGAFFASALALRGGIVADGYGAMSGGGGQATPELAALAPRPFYIGFGAHDSVGRSARALADVLRGAGWPVRVAEHPVGHGAKEIYLDEAFAFWREQEAR
ncbi:alpha/beta hydrolase [Sorangium sp. So ce233]|uniref:alpha/beta hydrolase n=1 Tax=Sorangium sp. So ce233 TaxID=3133290 RepID=UPI003F6277E1